MVGAPLSVRERCCRRRRPAGRSPPTVRARCHKCVAGKDAGQKCQWHSRPACPLAGRQLIMRSSYHTLCSLHQEAPCDFAALEQYRQGGCCLLGLWLLAPAACGLVTWAFHNECCGYVGVIQQSDRSGNDWPGKDICVLGCMAAMLQTVTCVRGDATAVAWVMGAWCGLKHWTLGMVEQPVGQQVTGCLLCCSLIQWTC